MPPFRRRGEPGNVLIVELALILNNHLLKSFYLGTIIALSFLQNLVGIRIDQAEKELIRNTLKMVSGNREQAAKILGIGERTLYRKIKEYGLS